MSEIDPAASSESSSDLLAELARQKERIARLESLLAETNRRSETPRAVPREATRPKNAGNGGQTPVRLSELGPELQGFAEAVMAYTAPKATDLPPKTQAAREPASRMTHEPRQPAFSPKSGKPRKFGRPGWMALLLGGALLTVGFAGAGVLYNRFLSSEMDRMPAPAAKHYQSVPPDPVEPPEVLPVEEPAHVLVNRPPTSQDLANNLQNSHPLGALAIPAVLPTAKQKPPQIKIQHHRRPHHRHKAAAPAAPEPGPSSRQSLPEDASLSTRRPTHHRRVETSPGMPTSIPVHQRDRWTDRPSAPKVHRRMRVAQAEIPAARPHAFLPSQQKMLPIHAYRHPRQGAAHRSSPRAHPGYDEKADSWMDRLP